jgi:hypothetical protein
LQAMLLVKSLLKGMMFAHDIPLFATSNTFGHAKFTEYGQVLDVMHAR